MEERKAKKKRREREREEQRGKWMENEKQVAKGRKK